MKILVLANHDDGLYLFRRELLSELMSMGHEVTVSVPFGTKVEKIKALGCLLKMITRKSRMVNYYGCYEYVWPFIAASD